MECKVTTQDNNNYIVSTAAAWIWITIERDLGYTMTEAHKKITNGSLEVITYMLYLATVKAEKTEYKTHQGWVENEFKSWELVVDANPKES